MTEVAAHSKHKFYGALQHAIKLIKGETIAGLGIIAITIICGVILGMTQMDLTANDAVQRFSLLAIGNYFASQIPSLLLFPVLLLSITGDKACSK